MVGLDHEITSRQNQTRVSSTIVQRPSSLSHGQDHIWSSFDDLLNVTVKRYYDASVGTLRAYTSVIFNTLTAHKIKIFLTV